jgi:hypothetical protein
MRNKIAIPVTTTELCSYGCGEIAKFKNSSKNLMCCESSSSCPAVKKKNANGLKRAYSENRKDTKHLDGKRGWSKGLTKETSDAVAKQALTLIGVRKITDEKRLAKQIYKEQCQFNLANIISRVEGYELLKKHGMYHRLANTEGVVRDHRISVMFGFENDIDPSIISHPANCRFIQQKDNARKSCKCEMTIDQLLLLIEKWDSDGN